MAFLRSHDIQRAPALEGARYRGGKAHFSIHSAMKITRRLFSRIHTREHCSKVLIPDHHTTFERAIRPRKWPHSERMVCRHPANLVANPNYVAITSSLSVDGAHVERSRPNVSIVLLQQDQLVQDLQDLPSRRTPRGQV